MIKISTVLSTVVDNLRRIVKLQILGRDHLENVNESMPYGEDSRPADRTKAIYARTSNDQEAVVIGYINVHQLESLANGEKRIFSTTESGDAVSSFIILRNDNTAEILGTGDFLVRYNELETAYNQLKSDHDGLVSRVNTIISQVDTFAQAYVPGGPSAVGSPATFVFTDTSENPSSGDITPAKIDELKTIPAP